MAALKKSSSKPFNILTNDDKENAGPNGGGSSTKGTKPPPASTVRRTNQSRAALKPTSLQRCMSLDEPDPMRLLGDPLLSSSNAWDFSDSEAAPASSWSTLPNRSLLCRPLPMDVGRCSCIIAKESAQGMNGVSLYFLYTNEGQGRQDRKLAVARHSRRNGRSEYTIAQNPKGIFSSSDDSFLGTITTNLVGSKYQIWNQGNQQNSSKNQPNRLLGVVSFVATISTCTGSYRSIRAWIPKHQSMQLKHTNAAQIQHISGFPSDWEEKRKRAHQLFSKVPYYINIAKGYELDFRERVGRTGPRIRRSVKNFQLTMEENGRQAILQLGRISNSKYVMDFRYPMTGYQAFCICLTSIDSKLCCLL